MNEMEGKIIQHLIILTLLPVYVFRLELLKTLDLFMIFLLHDFFTSG